ncbi:hypothetical protein [Oculatella sp. FACHB-28]|nr:hypothetical protein [Oculatella sp. FACHB-28]
MTHPTRWRSHFHRLRAIASINRVFIVNIMQESTIYRSTQS